MKNLVEYDGTLEEGKTYRVEVIPGDEANVWKPKIDMKLPEGEYVQIDWTNAGSFAGYADLEKPGRYFFTFEVVSSFIIQGGGRRHFRKTTYNCRILSVESAGENNLPQTTEEITALAKCEYMSAAGKQLMSYIFKFDLMRVLSGQYDQKTVEFEIEKQSDIYKLLTAAPAAAKEKRPETLDCTSDPKNLSRTICRSSEEENYGCPPDKIAELTFLRRYTTENSKPYFRLTNYKLEER